MTNFATPRKVAAAVTGNGTLVKGKHNPVNATSAAVTMTLPVGANEGSHLSVEKTDSSANMVTITGNIRGVSGSSLMLPWRYESVELIADAAGSWWPTAGHKTKTALDAAYAGKAESRLQSNARPWSTPVTLVSAQVDDVTPSTTNATYSVDTVNYKVGNQGHKFTFSGAVTADMFYAHNTAPITFQRAARVCAWIYLADVTKITSFTIYLFVDAAPGAGAVTITKTWVASQLKTGWNLLGVPVHDANTPTTDDIGPRFDSVYRIQPHIVTTAATDMTIGHIWLDTKQKAQLLYVADRGYATFRDNGLPDLRRLGVPVTWALDPALLGTSTGTAFEVITENDVARFAAAGDSISFHSWDGSVTSTMTAAQIRTDALKAIHWLQARGYAGRMWRAAWTQNNGGANAAAQNSYVVAGAFQDSTSYRLTAWPPKDRYNIPRQPIHGMAAATMDTWFDRLKKTGQLGIFYTHGINAAGGNDSTPTEWAYFISKVQTAITEGWLEAVTFEDLFARSGGKFREGFGGNLQVEYLDESGALVRRDLDTGIETTSVDSSTYAAGQATQDAAIATGNGSVRPTDVGLIGASGDPGLGTTANQTALTSGVGYVTRVKIDQAAPISKVSFYLSTATSSVTGASMDLYDSTGALLGSAPLATVVTSTGTKTVNLTTPTGTRAVGEWIYAVLWIAFTGPAPQLRGLPTTAIPNLSVSGASSRFGTYGTGLAATPASITPASIAAAAIGAQCHWVGVL